MSYVNICTTGLQMIIQFKCQPFLGKLYIIYAHAMTFLFSETLTILNGGRSVRYIVEFDHRETCTDMFC